MAVSKDEVERLAELARLRFEGAEAERLVLDLTAIFGHMEILHGVDLSAATAATAAAEMAEGSAPFRESEQAADALHASPECFAPEWRDDFFVVPRLPGVESGDSESGA